MIVLKKDDECVMCGKCSLVCPTHAISYEIGDYGNYAPLIHKDKCVQCHACEKVCAEKQQVWGVEKKRRHYVGYIKDAKIREQSSSGGLFSAVALWILSRNGIVIGAACDDHTLKVEHISISNEKDLQKLRKSKYVQSDWINSCGIICSAIKAGRWILFSGTPCQAATVKNKFGYYDKLICLDVFCHGVGTAGAFDEYLQMPEMEGVTAIDFRNMGNKEDINFTMYINKNGKGYKESCEINVFYRLYVLSAIMKHACLSCEYTKEHISDITIGDFCDYGDYITANNIAYPLPSIFSINTEKGEQVFSEIKEQLIYRELEDQQIISNYYKRHEDIHGEWGYNEEIWENFYSLYKKNGFREAAYKLLYSDEMNIIQRVEKIKLDKDEIMVYGAGIRGKRMVQAIRQLKPDWKIKCYIITEGVAKDAEDAIPIFPLRDVRFDEKNSIVVIAVSPQYREEILLELKNKGITRYI